MNRFGKKQNMTISEHFFLNSRIFDNNMTYFDSQIINQLRIYVTSVSYEHMESNSIFVEGLHLLREELYPFFGNGVAKNRDVCEN